MVSPLARCASFCLLCTIITIGVLWVPPRTLAQSTIPVKPASAGDMPAWYTTLPSLKDTVLARGKGRSRDQQTAIDKAVAGARSSLASNVDERWRALIVAIRNEGGPAVSGAPDPVILTGSAVRYQKVFRRGKVWTALILVAVPEASIRRFLSRRLRLDRDWYEQVRNTEAVRQFDIPPQ